MNTYFSMRMPNLWDPNWKVGGMTGVKVFALFERRGKTLTGFRLY